MILKIVRNIRRQYLGLFKPKMINGYKRLTDNVLLSKTRISNSTFIDSPKKFNVSDNVFIGHHNYIEASNGITIKEGCQVTNFVTITTHSSHDSIRLYGSETPSRDVDGYFKGSVYIGAYSFIGPHVTIVPGTVIGKGSIISAYSMVKGEFPPFSIIKGNPAKIVGSTKGRDAKLLKEFPKRQESYNKWVLDEDVK